MNVVTVCHMTVAQLAQWKSDKYWEKTNIDLLNLHKNVVLHCYRDAITGQIWLMAYHQKRPFPYSSMFDCSASPTLFFNDGDGLLGHGCLGNACEFGWFPIGYGNPCCCLGDSNWNPIHPPNRLNLQNPPPWAPIMPLPTLHSFGDRHTIGIGCHCPAWLADMSIKTGGWSMWCAHMYTWRSRSRAHTEHTPRQDRRRTMHLLYKDEHVQIWTSFPSPPHPSKY